MPTFAVTQAGYRAMWDQATVMGSRAAAVKTAAVRIIARRAELQPVEIATDVPWWMVGVILYRESDLDFTTYLGNGDPLAHKTVNVPAGRGPFASFVLGAIDALVYQGYTTIKDWSIERVLWACEEFNGWGYVKHNENSPYVWAGTTLEQPGKYDRDGHFNPALHDPQLGVAAVIKALAALDPEISAFVAKSPSPAVQPVPVIPAPQPKPKEPTVATPVIATNELVKITQALETAVTYLPMVSSFFPPLAPVVAFLPAIEAGLRMLEQIEAANGNWAAILTAIETNLSAIGAAVGQAKVKVAALPATGVTFQAPLGG